jgi:RNA polymerase sigma factor (sigma-70 family)
LKEHIVLNSADDYDRIIGPIEGQMIRSVWRIVKDPDEARDIFQEAAVRIWRRWERIRQHPNPKALILRICITCAYDALRMRTRHRLERLTQHTDHLTSKAPSPLAELMQKERAAEISGAIARLSRKQAVTVLMRFVEELPYEQIAAALGCSQATARTHCHRGCTRLAVELNHLLGPKEFSHES